MKVNKFTGTTAAVLSGALVLTACTGDDGGEEGSGGGGGEVSTVVVWDRAGAEATARQAFFDEWNQNEGAEAGVRVQYEPQATERYEEIVRTAFQTQRGPDIFHAPSSQVGGFVAAGWIQPLTGLVDDEVLDNAERYIPDSSELVWGGEPYGIPTTTFTVRLAINRGLFEQAGLDPDDPPTTFSEVEEAARAITQATNGQAFGVALPMAWVGFRQWVVDLPMLSANADVAQNGLFNSESGEYESELYEPIVDHYRTLVSEGTAFPGAETLNSDTVLAAFAEGRIGMYIASGSIVGGLRNLGTEIDFGTGPIPVPDGMQDERSPMNAGFPYSISSTIEDEEAVATAFEALVGPDMQEALAAGGIPPLSEEAWDSPAAQEDAWLQQFRPQDNDQQWPKTPSSVISVEGEDATTTISKLILDPSADAASALSDLADRYQQAYETGVDNGEVNPEEFGG